jgi:hypothetical protein
MLLHLVSAEKFGAQGQFGASLPVVSQGIDACLEQFPEASQSSRTETAIHR